jgi:transcription initiation factor TFIIB
MMVNNSADGVDGSVDATKSVSSLMLYPADREAPENQRGKERDDSSTLDVCHMCKSSKSVLFDPKTSETLCSTCGTVLREKVESSSPEWRPYSQEDIENRGRTGMPTSLAFHDMGLSTLISYSNADANGVAISPDQISKVNRMRHWNQISSNNRSYHRNLKNAFAILISLKDKLSLNEAVIEKSAYNYRKALDKQIIKGRSIRAMVVASIYASCRELNVPRTLDEIAKTTNADGIFAGKCYRLLVRNLKLRLPVVDSNVYLTKIVNRAQVSQKAYRRAVQMLSIIKEKPVSYGKDPNALAVAALYAACLKEGEKVSQAQIALAGDTSIVTLRKRFQDVKNLFPE